MDELKGPVLWGVDINKALFGTEKEKAAIRLQMIFLITLIGEVFSIKLKVDP